MSPRTLSRAALLPVLLALVPAAWGQMTITSVRAYYQGTPPLSGPGTNSITAFYYYPITLEITGTGFPMAAAPSVRWAGSSGTPTVLTPTSSTTTQIFVDVPTTLFASADPNVSITVLGPNASQSNSLPFPVNPPMTQPAVVNGTVGQPYSQPLFTGGTGPYTWQLGMDQAGPPPPPPPGLSITPTQFPGASPVLSGTPTTEGTYTFGGYIYDAWGMGTSGYYPITIAPALALGPATIPAGMYGAPYSQTFTATGGWPSYTYSFGLLGQGLPTLVPSGLSLDPATGVLSGVPTAVGTFPLNVVATDSLGGTVNRLVTLVINGPPITITTPPTLPNGTVGVQYSQTVQASGGLPALSWTLTGGALPAGLTLSAGGLISGTPTAAAAGATFTAQVSDSLGQTASRTFSLTIGQGLTITTASPLPNGVAGVPYSPVTFTATGALATPSWSVSAGTLPQGMALSTAGVLSGTPGQSGPFNFTVRASVALATAAPQVATKVFNLTIGPTNLTILTTSLSPGTETQFYSAALAASGATPPYTWSLASGSLPAGLTLNSSSGAISGIPSTRGGTAFVAQVTDSTGQTATRALGIQIQAYIPPLSVVTESLPEGTWDVPYSMGLSATGGEPAYSWAVSGLPAGLSAGADGNIGGKPSDVGTFRVSVVVTDSGGRTAGRYFSLVVKAPPLVITTGTPLAAVAAGSPVSETFAAAGGIPPYTWGISSGAIPMGTLFAAGTLSGSPSTTGDFRFTVQVRDSKGTVTNKAFSIRVTSPKLSVTTTSLPRGRVGQAYSAGVAATGGVPPYTWAIAGLPGGLSAAGAAIGGTPAATGTSMVTAEVTDSQGATASATLELVIAAPLLTITTSSPLPEAVAGARYSTGFAAAGGVPPYRWAAVAGWAGGLTLSAGGELSGVCNDVGNYSVYVQVTDSEGQTATGQFALNVVAPALTITTAALPAGTVGAAYSAGLAATGNTGPVRWSADGLPAGLTLDAGGNIGGTPSAPGTFTVNVQATDAAPRTASRSLSLTVGLPQVPGINFTGVPDVSDPAKQPGVQLGLDGTFPVPITGTITLTFTADGGGDDATVQFSNGRRTIDFTIPAGTNLATFTVPNLALQTGTVAGTITLTARLAASGGDITPSPAPARTIRVNRMPPVITRVTVTRTATGFDVNVTGYSSTREVSQATFRLVAAAGASLQTTDLTVPVDSIFTRWYQDAVSRTFGSQFQFTQSFTVQGEAGAVASVSVVLTNAVGRSNEASAVVQ